MLNKEIRTNHDQYLQTKLLGPCCVIFTQKVPGVTDSSLLQSTGMLLVRSKNL